MADDGAPARAPQGALQRVYEYTETALPRIVFAPPAERAAEEMLSIASQWQGRYRLTYVLLEPFGENVEAGRYDYHGTLDLSALTDFFRRHGAFIAADGRHALWIASADGRSLLIRDRHGFLTVFGDVAALKERLAEEGCRAGFLDPPRGLRTVNAELDGELAAMMRAWKWLRKPLNAHDIA